MTYKKYEYIMELQGVDLRSIYAGAAPFFVIKEVPIPMPLFLWMLVITKNEEILDLAE